MAMLRGILVLIWYAILSLSHAFSASPFCTNNSKVDTGTKPEGNIVFPSSTLNYTAEMCYATIRSPSDNKMQLTLVNLRRKQRFEQCHDSSIEIYALPLPINFARYALWTYCKSVGSKETLILKTSIRIVYRAPFLNGIGEDKTEDAISVSYKRLVCRHLLNAPSGYFGTFGINGSDVQEDCEWVINTGAGQGILLNFNIVNANYLDCKNNFIEVRQGENNKAPEWVKICHHSDLRRIKSSSTKLWIHVKSSATNGIRFWATYKTDLCKVVLVHEPLDFDSFASPHSSCQTWNLTAPSGKIAALSFSNIDLISTHSASCAGNVLEVWDGVTKTSYCNLKRPPALIVSEGRKLVVTYRSKDLMSGFQASFTTIFPSSYRTNCYIQDRKLSFKCNDQDVIPCSWECDGAMQCPDNSDESNCSDMQERWHKLQVFVIVIGSICASTVVFCIGLICFRKCMVIQRGQSTSQARRSRSPSVVDHSLLTPNADLPSPPPCYFTDRDEEPPASVIRGTYFFGDEFSQSGIHSASLFGIPPPRYRSTESLHRSNSETRSIWQRGMSSIPLVPTDSSGGTEVTLPEENPPDYESLSADKDEQIVIATRNNESIENAGGLQGDPESSSSECVVNESGLHPETSDMELQICTPETTSHANAIVNASVGIGIVNSGAALNV
jgi:hypothetical protein